MSKLKKPPTRPGRLERVLPFLRAGKSIRRRAWHYQSKIINVDGVVFVILPPKFAGGVPQKWQPYPEDLLAQDWVVIS